MKYCNTEHYEIQRVNPDNLEKLAAQRFAWRAERMKSNRLVKLYQMAGYGPYADRVELCATKLDFQTIGGKKVLQSANFCKLRLCPMCVARGAIVRAKLLSRVMDAVQAEHDGCEYFFLTLTVKNVPGSELGDAIGQLCSGWNKLMQHRAVKRAVKGWFRAIEITRNGDMYHPHIHAIVAVEHAYFLKKNGLWITHDEWVRRWQMALKVDYKPSVDVRKTTDQKGGKGAVLEAAKYVTKDSDYISDRLSDAKAAQIVTDYTRALYHRRLTAFGGWMKETAKRLQADDLDNVDLQQGDDETIRDDLVEMVETYYWHFGAGDYVLASRRVNPLRIKREGEGYAGK